MINCSNKSQTPSSAPGLDPPTQSTTGYAHGGMRRTDPPKLRRQGRSEGGFPFAPADSAEGVKVPRDLPAGLDSERELPGGNADVLNLDDALRDKDLEIPSDPARLADTAAAKQRRWRRWVSRVLFWVILAGGGYLGLQLKDQTAHYACAGRALQARDAQTSRACLDQANVSLSFYLMPFGLDLRKQYLALFDLTLELKDFQRALEIADTGTLKFPWEPSFWGDRALALYRLGRYQEAVEAFEKMMSAVSPDMIKRANPENIYLLGAEVYFAVRNDEMTKHYLNKVLELDFKHPGANLLYARFEAVQNHLEQMAAYYEKAQGGARELMMWQDLFLLALHYLDSDQIEKFQFTFARARRDFARGSGFHLLLAQQFIKDKNYASAYYEAMLETETGLADAAYFSEALQILESQYRKAFARLPAEPWLQPLYRFIQGRHALERKDYARAYAWITESVKGAEAAHPLQYLYLARAAAALSLNKEAAGYYQQVLEKQPSLAKATAELAVLRLDMGETQTAQDLWQRALMLDPAAAHLTDNAERFHLTDSGPTPASASDDAASSRADQDPVMRAQLNRIFVAQFKQFFHAPSGVLSV